MWGSYVVCIAYVHIRAQFQVLTERIGWEFPQNRKSEELLEHTMKNDIVELAFTEGGRRGISPENLSVWGFTPQFS